MNFAIVDDDRNFARILMKKIESVCKDNSIVSSVEYFKDTDSILSGDKFSKFHAIFMDIEMPGMNGIEAAKEINRLRASDATPHIVFVTAKDNLVFEALRQFPYSFIRKSFLDDVAECILRINHRVESDPTYTVKHGRDVKVLEIKRIIYLDKQGNYVTFHTADGEYQERSSVDEKYRDLSSYGFIRPHIGCLVNASHVIEFSSSCLVLSDGTEITMSRNYKKECKEKFQEWMVRFKCP